MASTIMPIDFEWGILQLVENALISDDEAWESAEGAGRPQWEVQTEWYDSWGLGHLYRATMSLVDPEIVQGAPPPPGPGEPLPPPPPGPMPLSPGEWLIANTMIDQAKRWAQEWAEMESEMDALAASSDNPDVDFDLGEFSPDPKLRDALDLTGEIASHWSTIWDLIAQAGPVYSNAAVRYMLSQRGRDPVRDPITNREIKNIFASLPLQGKIDALHDAMEDLTFLLDYGGRTIELPDNVMEVFDQGAKKIKQARTS